MHSLTVDGGRVEISNFFRIRPAGEVLRDYLAETLTMVENSYQFDILAHIDYPLRYWPQAAGPFAPSDFEDEFRTVLRALADSGRILEFNTRGPLPPQVLRWWREKGGDHLSFGSDAHEPLLLASGFDRAAAVAEASGFRGEDSGDAWRRS